MPENDAGSPRDAAEPLDSGWETPDASEVADAGTVEEDAGTSTALNPGFIVTLDGGLGDAREDPVVASLADSLAAPGLPERTLVIRFNCETLAPIGWQLVAGAPIGPTLSEALVLADDVKCQYCGDLAFDVVSENNPPDEFLLHQECGDYGAVAMVSGRSGKVVLGGGILWFGRGTISAPAQWNDPTTLGHGGDHPGASFRVRAWTHWGRINGSSDGSGEYRNLQPAIDALASTSAVPAVLRAGTLLDAVLLLYMPALQDRSFDEWVWLVNFH